MMRHKYYIYIHIQCTYTHIIIYTKYITPFTHSFGRVFLCMHLVFIPSSLRKYSIQRQIHATLAYVAVNSEKRICASNMCSAVCLVWYIWNTRVHSTIMFNARKHFQPLNSNLAYCQASFIWVMLYAGYMMQAPRTLHEGYERCSLMEQHRAATAKY